jgi:Holliday junction resolvasome RuvABC endonuclease subunit
MKPKTPKPSRVFAPLPCGAVLLALDVSSSVTGWAVGRIEADGKPEILDFGIIKPPSSWDSVRRTDCMLVRLAKILSDFSITHVCCEWQSHKHTGRRVQGLATLGQAQGAVRAYLSMTHKFETISEREWVRINGRCAQKEVRAEFVKQAVPAYAARVAADPKFDPGMDCADSLGILLFRANQ